MSRYIIEGEQDVELVRYVKIFLVLSVGLWGLVGVISNLSSLPETYSEVRNVTTMSGIPEEFGPPWRTANPLVVWIGVLTIVLGKIAAMVGGCFGGGMMLKNVHAASIDFNRSKKWAIAGCGLAFALTFFSFTLVAESTFFMFFNEQLSGAGEFAFRLAASFALVTLFVAQPELD